MAKRTRSLEFSIAKILCLAMWPELSWETLPQEAKSNLLRAAKIIVLLYVRTGE